MQSGSEPWIPDKQILEICHCHSEPTLLTPIASCEACSGFTHVTARRIAQPPKAAFVTRLQPFRLPGQAARQLPDQSTTLWVESSSTDDSRLRGAPPWADIPERYGPHTTCVNRFNRWRRAGVWDRLLKAVSQAYRRLRPADRAQADRGPGARRSCRSRHARLARRRQYPARRRRL